jgi:uncharacterized DUF497 family protein
VGVNGRLAAQHEPGPRALAALNFAATQLRATIYAATEMRMKVSFDPAKQQANLAKHGLDLADAVGLLSGPCLERIDDRYDYGEQRWVSIGLLKGAVAVCVWADRGEVARIISLRKATADEEKAWFAEFGG